MNVDSFMAASKAAETWLDTVSVVANIGRVGKPAGVDSAYMLLAGPIPNNLQDSYAKHADILQAEFDRLAAISDGPIPWHGHQAIVAEPERVIPDVWSNAHEAACGITRLALELLVWPLGEPQPWELGRNKLTDNEQRVLATNLLVSRWRAIAMMTDELAALQERIRRERAKLLANVVSPEAVWLGKGVVAIGDKRIALEPQEVNVLQALVELGAATRPTLEQRSGVAEAVKILKKIIDKHPLLKSYISLPGGRGKGGYSTTIKMGRS